MSAHPAFHRSRSPSVSPIALTIVRQRIEALRPDPANPRQHSARQIRQIARSIDAFGFLVPALVDGENRVLAGHGRLLAAKQLGHTDVPTIRIDHLSESQRRAFAIADNRLSEVATWDDALLAEQLAALAEADLDFDITACGFEIGEIDFRIHNATSSNSPDADDAVEPSGPPVSRLGDLWCLGEHRILCGDALDPMSYDRLMEGRRAALVVTDPPFNVRIRNNVSGLGRIRHREFVQGSGELTRAEYIDFLRRACRLLVTHSVDGSLHYVFEDWRHIGQLFEATEGLYTSLENVCIWAKDHGGMGSLYRSAHELIAVYKNGRAPHQNHIELGRFGRNRTNVWAYASPNSFGGDRSEGDLRAWHPTPKPVRMIADALLDASSPRDLVLDPFLGSGTLVIAAERTGRTGYAIELDASYVDVAVRRWERATGRSARLADAPLTFAEVEDARGGGRD